MFWCWSSCDWMICLIALITIIKCFDSSYSLSSKHVSEHPVSLQNIRGKHPVHPFPAHPHRSLCQDDLSLSCFAFSVFWPLRDSVFPPLLYPVGSVSGVHLWRFFTVRTAPPGAPLPHALHPLSPRRGQPPPLLLLQPLPPNPGKCPPTLLGCRHGNQHFSIASLLVEIIFLILWWHFQSCCDCLCQIVYILTHFHFMRGKFNHHIHIQINPNEKSLRQLVYTPDPRSQVHLKHHPETWSRSSSPPDDDIKVKCGSPQNSSGAWQSIRVAAFCWTTEAAETWFKMSVWHCRFVVEGVRKWTCDAIIINTFILNDSHVIPLMGKQT